MRLLQGIAASPGVAIGEALIIDTEGFRIPRRYIARDVVADELQRLNDAIAAVASDMERNREAISRQLGEQYGAIFGAHAQMLRDPRLYAEIESLIQQQYHSPEYAVTKTLQRYAEVFQKIGDSYLAERAHDMFDIERSLLRQLLGQCREDLGHLKSPVVVFSHNLTPTETATLDRQFVLGFATEIGGAGGHTAIVAKGMEIPAVVGVGNFLVELAAGDMVIVDGDHGRVILQPDEETIARYRREAEFRHTRDVQLTSLRDLPAETKDGARVELFANIEFPREVHACLDRGAGGIGLYRTEFLYLGTSVEPTEEEHFQAYAHVVQAMQGRPVVIRTVDLGADKMGQLPQGEAERNPFLGLRSIRLSLRNVSAFRTQLRAILRSSALGTVKIMFPLISTLQELLQAKMVLADAMDDLDEAGVEFDRNLQVGMMVEVPSAVITLDKFLREVAFFSIGTNDLVQYALAVDRSNNEVADAYQASDPAVLRLLEMTVRTAAKGNIPVSVCGQMSGEVAYIMLLLGLGLRSFSVPPSAIPGIKRVCRSVSVTQCEVVARRALTLDNAREIDSYLREELRKVVPELVDAW
jgi:phosphotransferase system enzyme I (PtsI)